MVGRTLFAMNQKKAPTIIAGASGYALTGLVQGLLTTVTDNQSAKRCHYHKRQCRIERSTRVVATTEERAAAFFAVCISRLVHHRWLFDNQVVYSHSNQSAGFLTVHFDCVDETIDY